jgi:hypothetical protein
MWVSDLNEYLLSLFSLTHTIIHTYNVFGSFLFSVIHSGIANFGEVASALLGAQLSLALVEAKLSGLLSDTNSLVPCRIRSNWSLVEVGLLYPALGLNREHPV